MIANEYNPGCYRKDIEMMFPLADGNWFRLAIGKPMTPSDFRRMREVIDLAEQSIVAPPILCRKES